MTSPVARLFDSLTNALLDLGLPTIKEWLRERLGPGSDVARVSMDGGLIHLDGVRVPIGPNGVMVLERASALVTALGGAGSPALRLHAFAGKVELGDRGHYFRADVSFAAAPEPEEAAWIWGELTIADASWSVREGNPPSKSMRGRARLLVSSREWRLDGGRLEGELFRGAFAGSGAFEVAEPQGEPPLVPPALSALALSLEHARVGPFLDAVSGLLGRDIAIPSLVPLDAELDGDLSWSEKDGGHVDLRVAGASLDASLRGVVGTTGKTLSGRVDANVRPALLLRGTSVPPALAPRDEDTIHAALDVGGELRRPEVTGKLRAREIGFRMGRARFVPAVVLSNVEGEVFLKDERAVCHATAQAHSAQVILDVDMMVRDAASARGTLRASGLDAVFLRGVTRTLGAKLALPEDALGSVDLALKPRDAPGRAALVSGSVGVATAGSRLVLDLSPDGARRISGEVSAPDLVATGLLGGSLSPVDGRVLVSLDVVTIEDSTGLSGALASSRLALAVRGRPELPPYIVEDAAVELSITSGALSYDSLRFRAHGGRFVGGGRIPFARARSSSDPGPAAAAALLDLELEDGGAEVAAVLAALARTDAFRVRVARDEPRPADERWVPRDLAASGHLTLDVGGALRADVMLRTKSGSALALGLRLSDGSLDGSTLAGELAVADAIASGFGFAHGPDVDGLASIDAVVTRTRPGIESLVAIRSDLLTVTYAGASFVVRDVRALVRVDPSGMAWNTVEAELYGGEVRSSGAYAYAGDVVARVSLAQVALHLLPALGGREPSAFVRGFFSGSIIGRFGRGTRIAGDVTLEDAAFPALDLLRPTLSRYGLRPPNEDAARPVTAVVAGGDDGIRLRDVNVELRGATIRGELEVSSARIVAGRAEVVLEEQYLRTSKLLTLPRALTDRIVLPVRVDGTLERPRVQASLGESLGRFLKDNRVSAFVTSAVEDAQSLFRGAPADETEPKPARGRTEDEMELDAELRRTLDAHHADWEVLRSREAERRHVR